MNDDENKNNMAVKWKKYGFWGLAIILWLAGVGGIKEGNYIASILTIILGIFACPDLDLVFKKNDFYSKYKKWIVIITFIAWFTMLGPSSNNNQVDTNINEVANHNETTITNEVFDNVNNIELNVANTTNKITLSDIPKYSNKPYVEINGNVPFFDDSELTIKAFEKYSELDDLGRVGIATACIEAGMDTEQRGDIKSVTPTAWDNVKYDGIDGSNLYNRCHLIANQLTGENDNEKNLMTGTRYMNTQGMERFENKVAEYVNHTEKHVLYRVTPMFEDNNLLANGVLIEAKSVEDKGDSIQFNVFCYNVQPGIEIDYKTGKSSKIVDNNDSATSEVNDNVQNTENNANQNLNVAPIEKSTGSNNSQISNEVNEEEYILNKNNKKFHYPWCSSVNQMKEKNKQEFVGTREELINKGYSPCQRCSP